MRSESTQQEKLDLIALLFEQRQRLPGTLDDPEIWVIMEKIQALSVGLPAELVMIVTAPVVIRNNPAGLRHNIS